MKRRLAIILVTFLLLVSSLSGCVELFQNNNEINDEEATIPGIEWFQTGNTLSINQLQHKRSPELEDNRIGIHFSDLWHLEPEVFPDAVLDASHILELGVKRARFAINNLDSDRVHWSQPENTIDPSHDNLITSLAENGITMTYVLSFWDKEYVAQGGELGIPRFKTEDEIQRYLDYVQFIVHHFKDRIEYYEIWNEPDIRDTIQWIEVEDYINLVKRTVPIIRQEYLEAKIVVGGVSYLISSDNQEYLFTILKSDDIMPLVDVISFHSMYGTSPEYDLHKQYYYNYPSLVQEIKDTASAHGFTGEYVADELSWMTPECIAYPYTYYSETKCAKYYARGIIINLGMDVIVSQFYAVPEEHPLQIVHTIQNLCTVMAGAEPTNLSLGIQSEATNIENYSFSLPNGDTLIALWTDGVAVDEDLGVKANLTIQGIISENVTGIDVLNGYQQPIIAGNENGNLLIENLIIRDYPLILHIEPEGPIRIHDQNISGEIKQDQIWSGTIHVTGDIEVEGGVTLTILPGTVVKVAAFSDDQHGGTDHPHDPPFPNDPDRIETQSTLIAIRGILNATGTSDNRIIFTSDSENPTTYDWDGLDISHGRLEYAIVEYARYNNLQESDVIVANNIFRNILECGIGIGHDKPISPQILYNDIYNCGHEGIDYAGGSALIKGNYFHRENPEIQPDPSRGGVGIVVYQNAYPIIEGNIFEKNSQAILFTSNSMHNEEQGENVIIRNNRIENNDVGFNIDPNYPLETIIMENNHLINNGEDEIHTG